MGSTVETGRTPVPDDQPAHWLKAVNPKDWLLEEYKLLSQHFFHEDNQIQKTTGIYATLNGGLLAFLASRLAEVGHIAGILLPAIGICLCLSWLAALIRLREWRKYIERRMKHIEESLHSHWGNEDFLPLDLRTVQRWNEWRSASRWFNWPYLLLRDMPSSITLMFLPMAFGTVWAYLLLRALATS